MAADFTVVTLRERLAADGIDVETYLLSNGWTRLGRFYELESLSTGPRVEDDALQLQAAR